MTMTFLLLVVSLLCVVSMTTTLVSAQTETLDDNVGGGGGISRLRRSREPPRSRLGGTAASTVATAATTAASTAASSFTTAAAASSSTTTKTSTSTSTTARQPKKKPNILFILADQMRWDVIRAVQDGLPQYNDDTNTEEDVLKIDTPHLDRLLKQGAYFTTAYTQCAVCAPARATLRTGCTIERHGVQHNDLTQEQVLNQGPQKVFRDRINQVQTIDHILVQSLGYQSEYYGKLHLPAAMAYERTEQQQQDVVDEQPFLPPPPDSNVDISRSGTITSRPPIFQHNDYDYDTGTFTFRFDSDGRKNSRYLQHFQELGEISNMDFPKPGMQIDPFTKFPYVPIRLDTRYNHSTNTNLATMDVCCSQMLSQDNVMGRFGLSSDYTPSYFTADVVTKALRRLQAQQPQGQQKPWIVTASFQSPHPPMVAPWEYLQKYWDNRHRLLVPPNLHDSPDNKPNPYKPIAWTDDYQDPSKVQEWTALYYALVEEVDAKVGELLAEIEDLDNTLIVFTSDHGEMLGGHGKRSKNNFYEEASRVPLLLSWPGVIPANTTVHDPVSHLDLVATLLDYVGASELDQSDGTSLRRYLGQHVGSVSTNNGVVLVPNEAFDQSYVVSEWDFRKPLAEDPHGQLDRRIDDRPNFLVRKLDTKLMIPKLAASKEVDMMFDLEHDPFEINNLLGQNAPTATVQTLHRAEHMRCLLLEWMDRMDGGNQKYYSDPQANYGEGNGDILEIQNRQSWPRLGFWTSHSESNPLSLRQVGRSRDGGWIRHDWLYLGTRLNETIVVDSVDVTGRDALFFQIQRPDLKVSGPNACEGIRVTFQAGVWALRNSQVDASIVLTVRDRADPVVVPLVLTDPAFVSSSSTTTARTTKSGAQ